MTINLMGELERLKKLKNLIIGDVEQKKKVINDKEQLNNLVSYIQPTNLNESIKVECMIQSSLIIGSIYLSNQVNDVLFNVVDSIIRTITLTTCPRVTEYLLRCLKSAATAFNFIVTSSQMGVDNKSLSNNDDFMNVDDRYENFSYKAANALSLIFLSPHLPFILKHIKSTNRQILINLLLLLTAMTEPKHKTSVISVDNILPSIVDYVNCDVPKLQLSALNALSTICKDHPPSVTVLRQINSNFIPSLTRFFNSKIPLLRLEASVALVNIIKSEQHTSFYSKLDGPPVIQLSQTIDRIKALELIEELIRLLDDDYVNIKIETSFTLANILSDATDLEDHACKLGILNKLFNIFETCIDAEEDEYNVKGSQSYEDNIRLQEGVLMIIAALAFHLDELRTAIVDAKLLKPISLSLQHSATGIRGAAAQCVRALSRSVGVLRTSLVDSGVEITLLNIISKDDEDERNRVIALMALANLVCGFSPLKDKLIDTGGIKVLVELTHSKSSKVRLNTLWAIKNMVFAASSDLKRLVCTQIGWNHFKVLLKDKENEVIEQVLFVIRNLVTRPNDISLVIHGFGGYSKFYESIEGNFSANTPVETLLQAAYVINNIATGSDEHKRSLLDNKIICNNISRLLSHWDERLRSASAWTLRNLTNKTEDQSDESHKDIINKIKRLNVENKLHALCDDQYSVSEAARLALDGLST